MQASDPEMTVQGAHIYDGPGSPEMTVQGAKFSESDVFDNSEFHKSMPLQYRITTMRHPMMYFETYLNETMGGIKQTKPCAPSVLRVTVFLPLSALGINQRSHIYIYIYI